MQPSLYCPKLVLDSGEILKKYPYWAAFSHQGLVLLGYAAECFRREMPFFQVERQCPVVLHHLSNHLSIAIDVLVLFFHGKGARNRTQIVDEACLVIRAEGRGNPVRTLAHVLFFDEHFYGAEPIADLMIV